MRDRIRARDRRRPGAWAARLMGPLLALGLLAAGTPPPATASPLPAAATTSPVEQDGSRVQPPTPVQAASLPAWDGSIDLYRRGIFTTQQTWRWCTAADVQMMRNIVRRETDHAYASQKRYWRYMRNHNRYDIPASDGVDPAGWAAGLRRFVDDRYRVVTSDSFGQALHRAVRALRRTGLPVGLLVAHGNHAWILTGFAATADPLVTDDFRVSSVRVVGPLWGLQSRTYGYDMRPDRKLSRSQLRDFLKRWHYGPIRMAWEGEFVTMQPAGG